MFAKKFMKAACSPTRSYSKAALFILHNRKTLNIF